MSADLDVFVSVHQAIAQRRVSERIISGDEVGRLIAGTATPIDASTETGGIDEC